MGVRDSKGSAFMVEGILHLKVKQVVLLLPGCLL